MGCFITHWLADARPALTARAFNACEFLFAGVLFQFLDHCLERLDVAGADTNPEPSRSCWIFCNLGDNCRVLANPKPRPRRHQIRAKGLNRVSPVGRFHRLKEKLEDVLARFQYLNRINTSCGGCRCRCRSRRICSFRHSKRALQALVLAGVERCKPGPLA